MCFSATASFTSGVLLSAVGAATIKANKELGSRLFAAIPMVFGLQQLSEGFVWLTLQSPGHDLLQKISMYIFLTVALVCWPTIMPLSVLLMERSEKRRKALYAVLAVGLVVSLGCAIAMLLYPVTAQISNHLILYTVDFPLPITDEALIAYVIATLTPLFISSKKRVFVLGVVMVLAYLVAFFFFREYLISVWCFLAALLSVIIYWIVLDGKFQINPDRHLHM